MQKHGEPQRRPMTNGEPQRRPQQGGQFLVKNVAYTGTKTAAGSRSSEKRRQFKRNIVIKTTERQRAADKTYAGCGISAPSN